MKKLVGFLEAYVQWVAVGLGVLWVLWMGYSYWANDPAVTDVGKKVTASDVDDELLKSTPVDSLDKAYRNEGPYPKWLQDALAQHKTDYVDRWIKDAKNPGTYPEVAEAPFTGSIQQAPPTPSSQPTGDTGLASVPSIKGTFALNASAGGLAVNAGMSVVNRPDPSIPLPASVPNGQQAPTTITPVDTDLVAQFRATTNPSAPPAPGAPVVQTGPKPIVVVPEEVTWVTVSGLLDMKKLAAAFQKANVPQAAAFTSILRVELVREEQQSDGSWKADPKMPVVPDLTNAFKPAMVPTTAPADDDKTLAAMYLTWANQHIADIVAPQFYDFLRGDPWRTATMPDPMAAAAPDANAAFDPSTVKGADVGKLTPEQQLAWRKWKKQQDDEAAKNRPPPKTTPTTPGGGSRRGAGAFAPVPNPDSMLGGGAADRRRGGGAVGGDVRPQAAPQQAQPVSPQDLPPAPFSPAQQQKDLEVWAHDETTVPGKVYRYKLRVYVKNPLFATQGLAAKPEDADVFALVAETDWSAPVNSPSKRDFFVSNGGTTIGGVPKVGIEYFKWEDGEWKQSLITLQPGDRVGDTPWTIVDLRSAAGNSAGESRVMLVNDSGEMATRFWKTDTARPEHRRLRDMLKAVAPAPGTPGTPGTPNVPGGGGTANRPAA